MSLSAHGHEVAVADNYLRRQMVTESGSDSLTPILNLPQRAKVWKAVSGRTIDVHLIDLCDYDLVSRVFREFQPEAVVHYGQQPSAPYSMMDRQPRGRDPDEQHRQPQPALRDRREQPRLPPGQARDDGRVRPAQHRHRGGLHRDRAQGPQGHAAVPEAAGLALPLLARSTTRPTSTSPAASRACARPTSTRASSTASRPTRRCSTTRLLTRFDYDEQFGTVLNRFCLQAVIGHPLTVYGTGGQTRGFLNIRDTLACVELALLNPADARRVARLQPVHRAVLDPRAGGRGPAGRRGARPRGRDPRDREPARRRRRSTTTTRPTPSCSTSACSRRCSPRTW